ncbi:unnamed protein product [Brachionus calyciflorus]|uniref:Uncharacterized protein n=1 Tax=Brachionus calyciflorus TaxID=104777 RepID=A0A814B2M1_9BILA|nr:unnamed protein product [Brachionus calyciflorus]
MNILNEAVSQLMSEFPDIFHQVENLEQNLNNNDQNQESFENLEENINNNRVGNFNDNFASNIQNGRNLDHFITQTKSVHNNKFNSTMTTYKIGFSQNMSSFRAAFDDIKLAFENLTNEFSSRMGPHDKIRIVLYHDSLERPISIPFLKKTDITPQVLIDSFERVAQSHKEVQLNENNNLTAHVIFERLPSGSGRKIMNLKKRQSPYTKKKERIKVTNDTTNEFQRFCENQPYVIPVFNNDNLCALRSIIIGKAYADNHPLKKEFAKPFRRILEPQVTRIVKELYLPNAPCGIEELRLKYAITKLQLSIQMEK